MKKQSNPNLFNKSFNYILVVSLIVLITVLQPVYSQEMPQIGIYPFASEGMENRVVEDFANNLESYLSGTNKVTLVERRRIEEVIEEQKLQKTCSDESCVVALQEHLSCDIVIGELSKYEGGYNITLKVIGINNLEILATASGFFQGNQTSLLSKEPSQRGKALLDEFLEKLSQRNAAIIKIGGPPNGATVHIDGVLIGRIEGGGLIKRSPMKMGFKLVEVKAPGHNTWGERRFFEPGKETIIDAQMRKKTKFSAAWRSLLLPGWGQLYTSDEVNVKRKSMGRFLLTLGTLSYISNVYSLNQYYQSKNNYDEAFELYMSQNSLDDILSHKTITQKKHDTMIANENTLKTLVGLTLVLGLGSAIEASLINFPDYDIFSLAPDPVRIAITNEHGDFTPTISLNITF